MSDAVAKTTDRKTFIGGSDAAAILGLSRWSTPLNLYYQKRGDPDPTPPLPDPQREKLFFRGKLMEPVVIKMLEREYPIKIVRRSTEEAPIYHVDAEYPFMAAQIDFEWEVTPEIIEALPGFKGLELGSIQNGEVKTVHPFAAGEWGGAESDEIPIEYATQGLYGLGVTGRQATLFVLLVGSDNLVPYHILRDEPIIQKMRARIADFWNKHVAPGVPPPPVVLSDVYRLLKRRMDTKVQATAETMALVQELVKEKLQLKLSEEHIEDLQFRIGVAILGATTMESKQLPVRHLLMFGEKELLSISQGSRRSVSPDLLEAKYPDVAKEIVKTSQYLYFKMPRKK